MSFIYPISPCLKRNFQNRMKNKASSRKNALQDFFRQIFIKNCFCNYERIFSLRDLKFGGSVYFYMRNKKGKVDRVGLKLIFTP